MRSRISVLERIEEGKYDGFVKVLHLKPHNDGQLLKRIYESYFADSGIDYGTNSLSIILPNDTNLVLKDGNYDYLGVMEDGHCMNYVYYNI